jgi:A/G-specific adenine glycosylase
VLIDKRKENGLLGGLWEFPGGKVEAGEDFQTALVREIKEELGVELKVGGEMGNTNMRTPTSE